MPLTNKYNFNTKHKAIYKLMLIANNYEYKIQHILKPFNITLSQYGSLRILRHNYPLPTNVMALRYGLIDTMSDITRLINRLQRCDLIVKKVCPDDKRITDVFITEKGINLLADVEKTLENTAILEHIDNTEIETLCQLLDKIVARG
jgi:DNA-binding MarR family transcriptional regulator